MMRITRPAFPSRSGHPARRARRPAGTAAEPAAAALSTAADAAPAAPLALASLPEAGAAAAPAAVSPAVAAPAAAAPAATGALAAPTRVGEVRPPPPVFATDRLRLAAAARDHGPAGAGAAEPPVGAGEGPVAPPSTAGSLRRPWGGTYDLHRAPGLTLVSIDRMANLWPQVRAAAAGAPDRRRVAVLFDLDETLIGRTYPALPMEADTAALVAALQISGYTVAGLTARPMVARGHDGDAWDNAVTTDGDLADAGINLALAAPPGELPASADGQRGYAHGIAFVGQTSKGLGLAALVALQPLDRVIFVDDRPENLVAVAHACAPLGIALTGVLYTRSYGAAALGPLSRRLERALARLPGRADAAAAPHSAGAAATRC